MAIPHIRIVERADQISTTTINPRNRMAIIGEFSSGPANTPLLLGSASEFANIYRSDTKKGSLAFQAAYDQIIDPTNADFVLLRVLGNQIQASGSVVFSGIAAKNNTLNFSFSYIGEVVNNNNALALTEVIDFNTVYNSSTSGRMYFYVDSIVANVATIKYQFNLLTNQDAIDWTSVTDNFTVDITTDQFTYIPVADGLEIIFGLSGQTTDLQLQVGNEFYTRINKYEFEVPVAAGETPYNISVNVQNYLSGIEPIGTVTLTSGKDGVVIKAEEDYEGVLGNRFTFDVTLTDTVSPGIGITIPSNNFSGGIAGPEKAYIDLYDIYGNPLVRVQAKYEGTYGNNIKIGITYLAAGEFNITIKDSNGSTFNPPIADESFNIKLINLASDGILNDAVASNLVDLIFLPRLLFGENYDTNLLSLNPERLDQIDLAETDTTAPTHPDYYGPTYLSDLNLKNGNNGPALTDQDFINAIDRLDSEAVNYVLAAGQYSDAIRSKLITHCENKTEGDSLRIAVLAADPRLKPSAARLMAAKYNSRYAVMVVGWATYAGQTNATRLGTEAAAFYLGKMVSIPFYMSPAYKVGAKAVRNILECDTDPYINKPMLDRYEENNLEVLAKSKAYRGYYFMTGALLSNEDIWNRVYIRRAYNKVRMDLYSLLEQYTAGPYRRETVNMIVTSINNYFLNLQARGEIAGFRNAYPAGTGDAIGEYRRGVLNLNVGFLPLSSLDFIEIGIFRDESGAIQLSGL